MVPTIEHRPAREAAAGKARLWRLRDPERDHFEKVTLPTQLVLWQSTAPYRNYRRDRKWWPNSAPARPTGVARQHTLPSCATPRQSSWAAEEARSNGRY